MPRMLTAKEAHEIGELLRRREELVEWIDTVDDQNLARVGSKNGVGIAYIVLQDIAVSGEEDGLRQGLDGEFILPTDLWRHMLWKGLEEIDALLLRRGLVIGNESAEEIAE